MIGIEYITIGDYIVAFDETPENRKTKVFGLYSAKDERVNLGEVKYNTSWRKYCFYPIDETVFDSKCLFGIISFLDELNNERKKK